MRVPIWLLFLLAFGSGFAAGACLRMLSDVYVTVEVVTDADTYVLKI